MATTCEEFSRRVETALSAINRAVTAAMAREDVKPDVHTQLYGRFRALSSFQSVYIGEVFHECTSCDWHELYHRLQLRVLDQKRQYENELEEPDNEPAFYLRFGGSVEAMRFLYETVDGVASKMTADEKADRRRWEAEDARDEANRTCTGCGHLWDSVFELDDRGRCPECVEHGVQEGARRRVARKHELRRQESLGETPTLPIALCRGCRQVVTESSGVDDRGYCLECVEYELDAK